ncbi:MAG: relaxase domain-containing protein [Planctomycetales bacterium]|nr:relaxase domain-containing protein [Planctomycetales bacterium]
MRVFHQKNQAAAIEYYTQLGEYYGPDGDRKPAVYFGAGAARLGLTPDTEVDAETFSKLCRNIDPRTEFTRLTQRNRADRRILTDLTFSAPKSVSLMWAISGDDRLVDAVQHAALDTLKDVEQDAATRVNHRRGEMTLRKTRNLVGVAWTHTTSRPVDGHPDPQLHVHGTVLNATHVAGDRWTAVDLSTVVKDSGYYGALFQSRLASEVQKLGYRVVRTEHNFEIDGIQRTLIEKFSRRTEAIEQRAKQLGIQSKDAKDALGAMTRDSKAKHAVSTLGLHEQWRSRLTPDERDAISGAGSKGHDVTPAQSSAGEAVDFAIGHHFERQSVVRHRLLVREALLHGIGGASASQIAAELSQRPLIRSGVEEAEEATTREVLLEEQRVVSFARKTRGVYQPLNPRHTIERAWLSGEQKAAIYGLLRSSDGVQILKGVAGSGKTTLMHEAIEAIGRGGKHVTVLAPQGETAHDLLREQEGFEADTLASFLVSEKAQSGAEGGVIWVDEAGQIGMHDMARLVDIAERIHARIILSGDTAQHKSVSRGEPLRLLESEAGLAPLHVRTIRRQEGEAYRRAVTYFSQGDVEQGFAELVEMGSVHEVQDPAQRAGLIARSFADAIDQGESTLVVAPSHAEREAITGAIREELKLRGHVGAEDRQVTVLRSRRLTEAQRSDFRLYEPGADIVEFHRNAKGGFRSGTRVTVDARRDGRIYTKRGQDLVPIPIETPGSFDVYRAREIGVALGDTLRITKRRQPTKGENTKRLNNGTLVTLAGFAANGNLKLSNGQQISPDWGHFDHGVTVTSHASQGKTFEHVIIAQSSMSFAASSREQAYVSASRGKQRLDWFTDSVEDLKRAIGREGARRNASELVAEQARLRQSRRRRTHDRLRHFATEKIRHFRYWLQHLQQQQARA